VINGGGTPFTFSTVFHTYYRVHTMPVTIRGFRGKSGRKDGEPFTDEAAEVVVDGRLETQRLYRDVDGAVSWETQSAKGGAKQLTLTKSANLPDIVVWNVGAAGAEGMRDMEAGGEQRYVCIEPGVCESAEARVGAGETWVGWQEVSVKML